MRKQARTLVTLCVALLLSMLVAACGLVAFAADGTDAASTGDTGVKSLVSTGRMGDGEIEWGGTGAPGSWDWELEEIKDAEQADGGDVILRHTLNEDGSVKEAGNFGFSRQSADASKAAYSMEGLTINFYASSADFMFIFTANSGWYNTSPAHFAIWFKHENGKTVQKLNVSPEGGEFGAWISGAASGSLKTDYVYESDPATEGYAIKYGNADVKPEFTGTLNTLQIGPSVSNSKSNNGHEYGLISSYDSKGKKTMKNFIDLDTRGVVADVISKFGQYGGFITVYQTGTSAQAIKITDIYNERTEWSATALPRANNVERLSAEGTVEFGKDEKCATALRTPTAGGGEYTVRHTMNAGDKTSSEDPKSDKYGLYKLFVRDLNMRLRYGEANMGDTLTVRLHDVAQDSEKYVDLAFEKKGASKAKLTVSTVDGETTEKIGEIAEAPFTFNGSSINRITLRDKVGMELLINDRAMSIDAEKLNAFISTFENEQAYGEFHVKETKQSTLSLVKIESKKVETFDSAEGFTATDKATIKSDDKYKMFYNAEDEAFAVTYDANKVIADSFEIEYRLGKYGNRSKGFRVSALDENGVGIVLEYAYVSDTEARVTVKGADGQTETAYGAEDAAFDWNYTSGNKTVGFVKSGRLGYLAVVDGDPVVVIEEAADIAAIDALLAKMTSKAVNAKFDVENEAKTAFAFIDYKYHVHTVLAPGWQEGATPSTDFGYAASDSVVMAFGGHTYSKTKSVLLDGFGMQMKTYVKDGNSAPVFVLTNSSSWYSDNTAIQFGLHKVADAEDKAHFILSYTNNTEGEYTHIAVGGNQTIATFEVDWHWNDGVANTISLACTDSVWRWTVNETVLTPGEENEEQATDYSDIYNELYPLFTAPDHTAYMQAWGGKNMVCDLFGITDYDPNVDPTVTVTPAFEAQKKGATLTLDLTTVFADANGDTLTFALGDETDAYQGEINGNTWTFACDKEGTYEITVYAYDGRGGMTECAFTVTVKKAKSKGGCGSSVSASATATAVLLLGACFVAAKRKQTAENK